MNGSTAGARFQLWTMSRSVESFQALVLAPLFTAIFVGLVVSGGRRDLIPTAALGAALVSLWNMSVHLGGNIIDMERRAATFEQLVSGRSSLYSVVAGRAAVIVATASLVLPEVWLMTLLLFGEAIPIPHPLVFVGGAVLLVIGLHSSAVLLSAVSVLARNRTVLQNALNYPFFLLGGLFVPVSALPDWLQPITRLIFLSWGSDLLRAALNPSVSPHPAAAFAGLAVTVPGTALAARLLLERVLWRCKVEGTLSFT